MATDITDCGHAVGEPGIDFFSQPEVRLDRKRSSMARSHVAGQQLADALNRNIFARHEREREVLVQGGRVDSYPKGRNGEKLFELACKVEDIIVFGVIQRSHTERI